MENEKLIAWKPIMNVGAILGLGLILPGLIIYLLGKTFELYYFNIFLQFVILIIGLIYGGRYIRDSFYEGYISYGRIFGISILMLFFASFIYAFYKFLLMGYFDQNLMDGYFKFMEEKLLESQDNLLQLGMKEDDVEKFTTPMLDEISKMKMETTALSLSQSDVFSITFWGGILALITSVFVKKNKNIFEQ